jgi:hypothetical protein
MVQKNDKSGREAVFIIVLRIGKDPVERCGFRRLYGGSKQGEKHVAAAEAALIAWGLMPALKCRPIKYVRFSAAS